MSDASLAPLADYFRYFSEVHAAPISPLYAALTGHVAGDEALLRLAAKSRKGQPAANLLLGAVHLLLQQGEEAGGLGDYYPSLGGTKKPDDEAARLFTRFVWAHEPRIIEIISTHVTNTNEVGRAALLLPAFEMAASEAHAPLYLVEIGPSCGLILCWDKYRYRYGDLEIGDAESPLLLAPEVKGAPPPVSAPLPTIAGRAGLEMHPVDLDDPHTLDWQLALIWPEHKERAARFRKAFAIARATPKQIIAGDAVDTLEDAIAAAPAAAAICVHHSFTMYQIPKDRRVVLSQILLDVSLSRPIWRTGVEWAGTIQDGDPSEKNTLGIARYDGGKAAHQHLAFCEPHGRWIEWGPTAPQDGDRL